MGDWAEPEDFGVWGSYNPLIEGEEDAEAMQTSVKKQVATNPEPQQVASAAQKSESKPAEIKPSEMEELHKRVTGMRKWFSSGTFEISATIERERQRIAREKALMAETMGKKAALTGGSAEQPNSPAISFEAMGLVSGGSIAQISDQGSPIVQQYFHQIK